MTSRILQALAAPVNTPAVPRIPKDSTDSAKAAHLRACLNEFSRVKAERLIGTDQEYLVEAYLEDHPECASREEAEATILQACDAFLASERGRLARMEAAQAGADYRVGGRQ